MADILSIGAGATQLYRQALSTVGNNIANLNTEGYSRQVSETTENAPSNQGTVFVGSGARLDNISRAYDEFAEISLRDSGTKLANQQPLIDYANRVVDIMGSEASGLSSAMDKFFAAASALSADPASLNLRSDFLRGADGMTARFRELSGQLDAVEIETREGIDKQIGTLNTLSEKLTFVNRQLNKKLTLNSQPPMLLDQRDQLLRDMSAVTKIHVTESTSGQVQVRLGSSAGSLIADTKASYDLGVAFDNNDPGRVDLILEPYGDRRAASAVSSGELGGLLSFRSQVLAPAMDSFDYLAQTMADEVNQIHSAGLDGRGEPGTDLFAIDPVFDITSGATNSAIGMQVDVIDPEAFDYAPFRATWVSEQNSWRIDDINTGAATQAAAGHSSFDYAGLRLTVDAMPRDGESFVVSPLARPASGIRMIQTDPLAVATAERMRVKSDLSNLGNATVSLEQDSAVQAAGFASGISITSLGNNPSTAASEAVTASYLAPAYVIPKGSTQTSLMMEVPYDSNLSFQVMTADGVHVLGNSLDSTSLATMLAGDSGFNPDSSYSDSYLNQTGSDAYLDMPLTYGFLASEVERRDWNVSAEGITDTYTTTILPASATSARVRLQGNDSSVSIDLISADALMLNGISLGSLSLAAGETSSAASMATWLNSASTSTSVTATASNSIEVPADDIDFTQQLTINGVTIGDGTLLTSTSELAAAINSATGSTNVMANVLPDGRLQVTNAVGYKGENITLGNPVASATRNALGQLNNVYSGQLDLQGAEDIRFTFGAAGVPADLAVLGLRTGIYVEGPVTEDLAVFVTGTGIASVAAGFGTSDSTAASNSLQQPFTINFLSATEYSISDDATGTVVATRSYSAGEDILHNGMVVAIDGNPVAGDSFAVDSNSDGIGDNGNMLRIAALQDKPILADGRTFSEAYIALVNTVGSKAALALMSKEAIQVVYDQAVASKDQVSGVSLDEEAADLIRFQQAYQASAQIIQVASKLFDSILSIR
jgi:flagellar hook-associated protein FlgK|tara:strand:+ start:212 stop:3217 length:3006 start_codon:yes stop_codon:yes gene_type:complete